MTRNRNGTVLVRTHTWGDEISYWRSAVSGQGLDYEHAMQNEPRVSIGMVLQFLESMPEGEVHFVNRSVAGSRWVIGVEFYTNVANCEGVTRAELVFQNRLQVLAALALIRMQGKHKVRNSLNIHDG